jgi:integrase
LPVTVPCVYVGERSLSNTSTSPLAQATASRNSRSLGRRQTGTGLHTPERLRKYLTTGERDAFLREAEQADRAARTLCMTLAYAGCRLSEALALTDQADLAAGVLTFESLTKRRTGINRNVPVPPALLRSCGANQGSRRGGVGPSTGNPGRRHMSSVLVPARVAGGQSYSRQSCSVVAVTSL